MLASAPNVVTGHPSLAANSLKELIALAKKQPGKLQYASAGIGTFPHLGGELFKLTAGIDLLHVPFKGSAPALIDVVGGHTQLTFATIPSSLTHIRSGKLKVFGVGGMQRNALIPEVPTVDEAGLPGYAAANWNGILAPAGTPRADHRAAAQGNLRDPGHARDAEAVHRRRRRRRADEPDRIRGLHRVGNRPNGAAS